MNNTILRTRVKSCLLKSRGLGIIFRQSNAEDTSKSLIMLHREVEKERTFAIRLQVNVSHIWRVFRYWIGQVTLLNLVECHVLLHILSIEALFADWETCVSSIQWANLQSDVKGFASRSLVGVASSLFPCQYSNEMRTLT